MHRVPTKIAETLMNLFLINTFESAKLIQIAWNEVTLLLPSLFCSDWYGGLGFFKIWRLHAVISFRKFWWTVRFVLSHFVWKMRITVWTFVLPSIFAHFIKNCDPKHAEYDKRQFRQSLHQSVSYFLLRHHQFGLIMTFWFFIKNQNLIYPQKSSQKLQLVGDKT